jgi:hypothetical protein
VAGARDLEGAQVGLISVAREIAGAQLGVVNVAKRADLQVGVVNVAERIDGAAIGLFNVAGNGRIQPTAWTTSDSGFAVNTGLRFVAGYAFSQVGIGYYPERDAPRSEAGGGLHLPWQLAPGRGFLGDGWAELGGHVSSPYQGNSAEEQRLHYRASLGVRIAGPLSLLAGAEVNHVVTDFGADLQVPRPVFGLTLL